MRRTKWIALQFAYALLTRLIYKFSLICCHWAVATNSFVPGGFLPTFYSKLFLLILPKFSESSFKVLSQNFYIFQLSKTSKIVLKIFPASVSNKFSVNFFKNLYIFVKLSHAFPEILSIYSKYYLNFFYKFYFQNFCIILFEDFTNNVSKITKISSKLPNILI